MIYKDSKGNIIQTISDWENHLFKKRKQEHWKPGRSAYEIADYLMNNDGEKIISEVIEKIIKESVVFDYAIPEMEVRFDKFGHGREHDVGIFGETKSKKRFFVGIESKVDETFNNKILNQYLESKSKEINGVSTNSGKRIEQLLKLNFEIVKPEYFDLRYQLLYSTAGTIEAKENNNDLDIYFLIVIVFKTDLYNELKGIENYKDYIQFVNALNSTRIKNDNNLDIHKVKIGSKELNMVYMNIDKK